MNALIMITLFDSGQSDRYVDTAELVCKTSPLKRS
jgi:hypothetical protein